MLAASGKRQPERAKPIDRWHVHNAGSDYMVDAIKHLGYDYFTCMPGSTFRGIHESIINYGGNSKPEMLSCVHEEISAAMAHGYAKMAGKPMAILVHNTVGLQHASMAIYNAYADRVPMLVLVGNIAEVVQPPPRRRVVSTPRPTSRRSCAASSSTMRSPASLQSFGEEIHESALDGNDGRRTEPTLVIVDADLAEMPVGEKPQMPLPKYSPCPLRRRSGRPRRRCEGARQRAEPRDRCRSRGAHERRHGTSFNSRKGCRFRSSISGTG